MHPRRTNKLKIAPKQIDRARLGVLLDWIGAMPNAERRRIQFVSRSKTVRLWSVEKWPHGMLWDLYEKSKSKWKDRVAVAHPDRGGNHEDAAMLNAVWARIKFLFARLGIEEK